MSFEVEENPINNDTYPDLDLLNESGKNAKKLICTRCDSIILRENLATLVSKDAWLHHAEQKSPTELTGDTVKYFWTADDMWTFDNLGFTRPLPSHPSAPAGGQLKYLICGACDNGIIGIQQVGGEDNKLYVSHHRVKYR